MFIQCPAIDLSYQYKVYSIHMNGVEVKRKIGLKGAMGATKFYKYNNFKSEVSLYNAHTGNLVRRFK